MGSMMLTKLKLSDKILWSGKVIFRRAVGGMAPSHSLCTSIDEDQNYATVSTVAGVAMYAPVSHPYTAAYEM